MLFQRGMVERSKPRLLWKDLALNSAIGMLKCCQVPKVSTNLMSTILAPSFLAISNTLLGVLIWFVLVFFLCLVARPRRLSRELSGQSCMVQSKSFRHNVAASAEV